MKRILPTATVFGLLCWLIFAVAAPTHGADLRASRGRKASWCGTWDWGIEVALARREVNRRRVQREFRTQSGSTGDFETAALQIEQNGNVAVIRDDGSLVAEKNPFDFRNQSVKFIRRGVNGYKFRSLGKTLDADLGDKLTLGDDDAVRVDLPGFEITFFGQSYGSLYINSDGNLTFGKADTASTPRDLQRLLSGQPRIAPFFADLDPSAVLGEPGVYLRFAGAKIIVTWWRVPEFGKTNSNTFQITVNPRGNIEVLFGDVAAREGIVGVAPGGGSGLELVDLTTDLPIKRKGVAMAERFTEMATVDEASVAAAFFDRFADDYDQLILFTDFGRKASDSAIAYFLPVQNKVRGIGRSIYNASRFFGSSGRLAGFVNMGGQSQYSSNVTRPTFWQTYSATDILAHEFGHQWLVSVTFIDSQGRTNRDLLGRGDGHWNFYLDSDLSFMEGNEIRDDGNGMFTTLQKRATYNPFDRYLMGLIPASEVPEKFYVQLTSGGPDANVVPVQPGETVAGNRIDVSIDQIIASLGARSPTASESQKDFRIGLILLVKQAEQPSQSSISKVQDIAREIEKLFRRETGNRGTIDTGLISR